VVTIGTDDGFGEADGFVAAGPVEGRFEDDFFRGIALRFVKTGGGFGFAEDVGDAVIADAVAGTEIARECCNRTRTSRYRLRIEDCRLAGHECARGAWRAR